jgi:solute carrier family 25 (mitochondrial phosphate transporter), member 23/24/25/41
MRVVSKASILFIGFLPVVQSLSIPMPPHSSVAGPAVSHRIALHESTTVLKASLKASSAANAIEYPEQVRGGDSAQTALRLMAKIIPALAACGVLGVAMTSFLAPLSSPAAQGAKLVFAGAVAGIISRTCCAPIEMVSTVMMCRGDECVSMKDELMRTWKAEGIKGMFKGNGANCLKVAPSRGTQFLVYEFMKRQLVIAGWGVGAAASLNAGSRLLAGGIAGMVAASIVYPLEVVKTMLTLYPDQCSSIGGAVRTVFNNGGIPALYRGLGPTLVAMFPYVGMEFMVYETLKKRWEVALGPAGTIALLLLGALGGASAQATAHPLDVIRRRMQMQSMRKRSTDSKDKPVKNYSNMFSGLYRVGKEEGWHVLFNGLGPACLEKIPSTAIGYYIYEAMKVALKVSSV